VLHSIFIWSSCINYFSNSTNRLKKDLERLEKVTWTVHPMMDNPKKGITFWIILPMVIWLFYWNIEPDFSRIASRLSTVVVTLILLIYFSSIYLSTRFTIDSDGVAISRWLFTKRLTWKRVRSMVNEKNGVFISPFPVRTRMENFRGVFLFYRDNQEEVIDALRSHKPDLPGMPEKLNGR